MMFGLAVFISAPNIFAENQRTTSHCQRQPNSVSVLAVEKGLVRFEMIRTPVEWRESPAKMCRFIQIDGKRLKRICILGRDRRQ